MRHRRILSLVLSLLLLLPTALPSFSQQKRSLGLSGGYTGVDAVFSKENGSVLRELSLGADSGYDKLSAGGRISMVWSLSLVDKTSSSPGWNVFAGAGVQAGYVNDLIKFEFPDSPKVNADHLSEYGVLFGAVFRLSAGYVFKNAPVGIYASMSPVLGLHFVRAGHKVLDSREGKATLSYGNSTEIYDAGLDGLYPSLSLRYYF